VKARITALEQSTPVQLFGQLRKGTDLYYFSASVSRHDMLVKSMHCAQQDDDETGPALLLG